MVDFSSVLCLETAGSANKTEMHRLSQLLLDPLADLHGEEDFISVESPKC